MLSLIVVATMILLVIIQQSRAEARGNQAKAEAAQKDAEAQLQLTQKRERERDLAEAAKTRIAADKVVVDQKLDQSQEDLKVTNAELVKALDVATERAEEAKRAQHRAEENARIAEKAQGEAVVAKDDTAKANRELQKALKAEQARVKELEDSIGSKPIDNLKPLSPSKAHP